MPKRTNEFQRLIHLVQHALSAGATVSESKMLEDRLTHKKREVDVVVEGTVGANPVLVSIECRDHRRVADVTWVDSMQAKHSRLPTNALILVSRRGFTPEAMDVAGKHGIKVVSLSEVETTDFARMLSPTGELWLRTLSITPTKVRIDLPPHEALEAESIGASNDNLIYLEDGSEVCAVGALVAAMLHSPAVRDPLLLEGKPEHKGFEVGWGSPFGKDIPPLFMKKLEPPQLRPIGLITITGRCEVEVAKFGMRQGMLGDAEIAWGNASSAGHSALLAAARTAAGETRISMNIRRVPTRSS